jgi:starch-binding outer membrane protein, SusD/RagB family
MIRLPLPIITIGLITILTSTSCKKIVAVDPPSNFLTASNIFQSDSSAQASVTGLYIMLMNQTKVFINGGISLFSSLSADELTATSLPYEENQFLTTNILSGNTINANNFWKAAYARLYQCNICLEKLQASNSITLSIRNKLIGEASFIRALCYYYLVNLYGDVPLVLTTNTENNSVLPRTPVANVYVQIIEDLKRGDSLLGNSMSNFYPSSMACKALMAQVYLHLKDWKQADNIASGIINTGKYFLEGELNNIFLSTSHETIFQFAPVIAGINTTEGNIYITTSQNVQPTYCLSTSLLNSFEPGDLRKLNWTKSNTINGSTFYYPCKYKIRNTTDIKECNIILRLAQLFLIRAEARIKQGDLSGAHADINTIRTRAGIPVLPDSLSEQQLQSAIEQENKIEFFTEMGHRWFDLKRWNKTNEVLSGIKGTNWQTSDQLYPIPHSEILADPYLEQNLGYN